ncbi:MAG: hypothetical protein EP329_21795 [Deltaproteobacteria bacterium]|nr:MAG: hypothetical protein EP329_21795 [Deltaproteobacteria bacterium]
MRALRTAGAIVMVVVAACDNQTSDGIAVDEDTVVAVDTVAPDTAEPAVVCAEDQCKIGDRCYDNGEVAPDNPCGVCVVVTSASAWTANDAATCDDDDPCTVEDHCLGGKCTGGARDCDDDDPCTRDRCDAETGACVHEPHPDGCEADPCEASGDAASCDDHNPCTADYCQPWVGCVHTPLVAKCDDGDACTTDDVCVDGLCVGAAPRDCDDADICTVDVCKADGGCSHTAIGSLCRDDNPCTDEACDPVRGCVFPFNTAPCDDHDACTAADTCTQGACLGRLIDPDDGNPCTDDLCDHALGVMHVPNRLPCDDGNACTVGDICADGQCTAGATPLGCDDGNLCTDDSCDPASGCVNTNNTVVCDDESACTAYDRCFNGGCTGVTVQCDDGNVCTADSCDPQVGCKNELIMINDCRPTITVTYPPRGETILGAANAQRVVVTGTVASGAGPITGLTINGVSTSVEPSTGAFSRAITPSVGGNTLVIEATDALGTQRRVVQSYLWSTAYHKPTVPKNGIVAQGIGVWLDKDAIDDHNRALPPNDLGTIFELALQGFDINAMIPVPAAHNVSAGSLVGKYDIYVRNLTYNPPKASLSTRPGGLQLHVSITNGHAEIQAKKTCSASLTSCWGPSSISGDLTFSSITIDATINLSVSNHALVATISNSAVKVSGTDISINGAFGFIADFILGFFIGDFEDSIEQSFNDSLRPVLGPLISDALSALAFSTSLDIPQLGDTGTPISVDLLTDFQGVDFDAEGGRLYLRAGGYASQKATPYDNLGLPDRVRCNAGGAQLVTVPEQHALELVVSDDTLNSLLYAAWRGGLLELDVPAEWLAGADLTQFGISGLSVSISGMLAPTASDCGGDGFQAAIGDLRIRLSMSFAGQSLNADLWVSASIGINLGVADGQLNLTLDGIANVETQVEVAEEGLIGAESALRSLIEAQIVGGLVDQLSGTELGSIPLPDIDLSGAIPGLPAGTGIRINPQVLYRDNGNMIVGGKLN